MKTTITILIKDTGVKKLHKAELKKIVLFFNEVDEIGLSNIRWDSLIYQRNNQNYEMLINVCYFVLDGMIQTTNKGNYKMMSFSDEHIHRLYEKFVLEYFKQHHSYLSEARAAQVKWDLPSDTEESMIRFLPVMQTDIFLRYKEQILIIDTKYYGHTMQMQYDKATLHSGNMYQIFTYVKNQDVKNTGNVWSRIFCTRWNGLNRSGGTIDAFDDAEYSGSVLSLIDNGEAFIKRNAKLMWRKTANSREEMPEYVERSYHEALVNALAHRDYLVNGSEVHIDIYDDRMEIYSPGGMPDGSIIQDRDPLTVPSTRRNPVLADIFNRLGYMERKGSGFGKIIGGYEFQINYDESKKPSFRSDRYQFTVVMPNLNYNVPQNVPQDVPRNVPQKKESNPLEIQILNMIKKDNKISTEKMAMTLGISSKTVKRHIKDIGIVRFIGRGSNGHWEIIDD